MKRIDKNIPISEQELISKDPGNLLQERRDGLYYGHEVKQDYSRLYVNAVTGNDNNPGTQDRPLRTFAKALSLPDTPGNRTIFLYQAQNHDVANLPITPIRGGTITVYPYGPNYDFPSGQYWVSNPKYHQHMPTIHFRPSATHIDSSVKDYIYTTTNFISPAEEVKFNFYVINFVVHEHALAKQIGEKKDNRTITQSSFEGGWGSYHKPVVNVSLYDCGIHFDISDAAIKKGYQAKFFNGNTRFHGSEEYIFDRIHHITGNGQLFKYLKNNISIIVSDWNLGKETFQKYFNNIVLDKHGGINCNINAEVKPFINGW